MKSLNKIVLINCGDAVYNEIDLNGNILLIGSNGTGKSSILRTILFFYNADPQKLDIRKNQKSFMEYYFQTENSYIIYEVKTDSTYYSVLLYRSRNNLRYYFINFRYMKDLYIFGDKALTIKEIIKNLNQRQISYSKLVTTYSGYLSTLYGGQPSRKMREYAFLEGGNFQSIPRTISNIFINAAVESNFLKKIIINSMEETPFKLSLDVIQTELKQFDENFSQLKLWRKHEKEAVSIIKNLDVLRKIERESESLIEKIGENYKGKTALLEELNSSIEDLKSHIEHSNEQFRVKEKEYRKKSDYLTGELAKYAANLEYAKERNAYFKTKNIEDIITESEKKPLLLTEFNAAKEKLSVMTEEIKDIERSFEQREAAIVNEQNAGINFYAEKKNALIQDFTHEKSNVSELFQQKYEDLERGLREQVRDKKNIAEKLLAEINEIKVGIARMEARELYAAEYEKIRSEKAEHEKELIKAQSTASNMQLEKEKYEGEVKRRLSALDDTLKQTQDTTHEKILLLEKEKDEVLKKIEKLSGSFYEYLNKNYPEWWETIGKVCTEDVLLNCFLDPSIHEDQKKLFYGVEINLNELETDIPTAELFRKRVDDIENDINLLHKSLKDKEEVYQKTKEKEERKYNEYTENYFQNEKASWLNQEQLRQKIKKADVDLNDLKGRSEREKKEAIDTLKNSVREKEQKRLQINERIKEIEAAHKLKRADLKKEQAGVINSLKDTFNKNREEIEKGTEKLNKRINRSLDDLEKEKERLLKGKDVDYDLVKKQKELITTIAGKLDQVKSYQNIIIEYKKDLREWIEKIPVYQDRIKELDGEKTALKQYYETFKAEYEKELDGKNQLLHEISAKVTSCNAELSRFRLFAKTELFKEIEQRVMSAEKENVSLNLSEIIKDYESKRMILLEKKENFKQQIIIFTGYFKEDNHFQFYLKGMDYADFIAVSERIERFIKNNEIEAFENEIESQYAMLINSISSQVTDLISMESQIQTIITKINSTFKNSNFVGVIKSIELRILENRDIVMTVLREIQQFVAENKYVVGQQSLFNMNPNKNENRKAIDLLSKLQKRISEYKKDEILLENAFSLEVRIKENNNDTGWAEKISGVGSNGTDVLAKIMIYITLISVFKDMVNRKKSEFKLHCLIDEVGILDNNYLKELMSFANSKDINLVFGAPNENNVLLYDHIYEVRRDTRDKIRVSKLISKKK